MAANKHLKFAKQFFLAAAALMGISLSLCMFVAWSAKPEPLLISPETTFICEPLDAQGYVDYCEALNRQLSENLTPETNAAVFYMRAWGDSGYEPQNYEPWIYDEILMRLGIKAESVLEKPFALFWNWSPGEAQRNPPGKSLTGVEAEDYLNMQYNFLWGEADFWPEGEFKSVDRWLQRNRAAGELIRKGASLPGCYFPVVAMEEPFLSNAKLEHFLMMRDYGRYFTVSAIKNLSEKRIDRFLDDIRCIDQLGRHLGKGPFVFDKMFSVIFRENCLLVASRACTGVESTSDLKKIIAFVQSLEVPHDLGRRIDQGHRFKALEYATCASTGAIFVEPEGALKVDWNVTLRYLNTELDRAREVANITDFVEFRSRAAEYEKRLKSKVDNAWWMYASTVVFGRKGKGEYIGNVIYQLVALPEFIRARIVEEDFRAHRDMVCLALAVAAYRVDHGTTPDSLSQLLPGGYLDAIPTDVYNHNKEFILVTTADGGFRIEAAEMKEEVGKPASKRRRVTSVQPGGRCFEEYVAESLAEQSEDHSLLLGTD